MIMFTGIFNDEHICSLNMTDDEWKHVRKEARNHDAGKLTSPFSGEPMMCVQNRNGLRFFRMHKGCHDGMTEPETQHHIRLKYEAMNAAREIGLKADVEVPADDRRWIADVMIEKDTKRIAIEIQWSKQTDDDFEMRTKRYRKDGVSCIWFDANINPDRTVMNVIHDGNYVYDDNTNEYHFYDYDAYGFITVNGVVRIPVNKKTEKAIICGHEYSISDVIKMLLIKEGHSSISIPKPHHMMLAEYSCRKCNAWHYAWKSMECNPYANKYYRIEQDAYYQNQIDKYAELIGYTQSSPISFQSYKAWDINKNNAYYMCYKCDSCGTITSDYDIFKSKCICISRIIVPDEHKRIGLITFNYDIIHDSQAIAQ